MIARFTPAIGVIELAAAARPGDRVRVVGQFEEAFARTFDAGGAIAFSYGRTALWAFLKAVGISNAEIIQPAYTCVVVAHATVLSGNVPRFVDVTPHDYNMDLDQVEAAISPRTRAIVATHLFGYPLDVDRLRGIVRAAEARHGHKIWVIQDCAHSFGARWRGRLVCGEADIALFGLNVSKMITSIFGGMLAGSDETLLQEIRRWRDRHCAVPGAAKAAARRVYLAGAAMAFSRAIYGTTHWLQTSTPFLDRLTKAYHLDDQVRFPPDYLDLLTVPEANVGLAQLARYEDVVARRRATATHYAEALRGVSGLTLPPLVEGATYSHFPVRVDDPQWWCARMAREGVELGRIIDYSVPHMSSYAAAAREREFPVSLACSTSMINLPMGALSSVAARRVTDAVKVVALSARAA